MVALLVSLKLRLLRNSLRRSVWRTVGLVLGAVYALGLVSAAVAGLVALRWTSTAVTGQVTVVAYAALSLSWLLLSLLVFGVADAGPGRGPQVGHVLFQHVLKHQPPVAEVLVVGQERIRVDNNQRADVVHR